MSFSNYKSVSTILQEFQITYQEENFITPAPFNISPLFQEDLEIVMGYGVVDNSEFAICENLIYPILKEVWKAYRDTFILWSHQSLTYNEKLSEFPEYILAKRSPLGRIVFGKPYLLLVEAKQDKFDEGWGQCLAEMVAASRLNQEPKLTVFGIVSNGKIWQFGKLEGEQFTRSPIFYLIQNLGELFGAVNYVFQQCQVQVNFLAVA